MNVIDCIPIGKKNAISRERLAACTGLRDRAVRDTIHNLRLSGNKIISSSNAKGYYIGTDEEWAAFRKEQFSRARSILEVFFSDTNAMMDLLKQMIGEVVVAQEYPKKVHPCIRRTRKTERIGFWM